MAQVPQPYLVNFDFGQRIQQAVESSLQRDQENKIQQAQLTQRESEFLRNLAMQQENFITNMNLEKQRFDYQKQIDQRKYDLERENIPAKLPYEYGGRKYNLTTNEIEDLNRSREAQTRITEINLANSMKRIGSDPRIQALKTNYQKAVEKYNSLVSDKDQFGNQKYTKTEIQGAINDVNRWSSLLEQRATKLGLPPSKSLMELELPNIQQENSGYVPPYDVNNFAMPQGGQPVQTTVKDNNNFSDFFKKK